MCTRRYTSPELKHVTTCFADQRSEWLQVQARDHVGGAVPAQDARVQGRDHRCTAAKQVAGRGPACTYGAQLHAFQMHCASLWQRGQCHYV